MNKPVDYEVAKLPPAYRRRIATHFVQRCHERGMTRMTYNIAVNLNKVAKAMQADPKFKSKVLTLYREPAWSTKIYQVQYDDSFFYLIFDSRKDGFVTAITQEQMDERDSETSSLHSRRKK